MTKSIAVSLATSMATLALVAGGTLASSVQPVSAATITESTNVTGSTGFFPGQSVTTPGSGEPWNNITFNWFSNVSATTPTAFGTLFLLNQSYAGTPASLSSAITGFLAQSQSISGGQYIFDPTVVLQPNTQYFFYANQSGTVIGANFTTYLGGSAYGSFGLNSSFVNGPNSDASFRLSGTPVATAVPTPALLPGLIGMGVAAFRKRRAEAQSALEKV